VGQNWSGGGLNIRTKLSNGDGTWTAVKQVLGDGAGVHTYPTLTGDVNGDGRTDLIFVGQNSSGGGLYIRTKLSKGDGTWTAVNQTFGDGAGVHTYPTLTGDVNGDGRTDVIFVGQNSSGGGLYIRTKLSKGDGTWTAVNQTFGDGAGVHTYPTLTGDVNGDGRTDVIFAGQNWSGAGLNIRTKLASNNGTWDAVSALISSGANEIWGDSGDDILQGGAAVDVLRGGNDDDSMYGGDGNDDLRGGAGNDVLNGQLGIDVVLGQTGYDVLRDQSSDDALLTDDEDFAKGGQSIKSFHAKNDHVFVLSQTGKLRRYAQGAWETMPDVQSFNVVDGRLETVRTDGTRETTYLSSSLPKVMANRGNGVTVELSGVRGIIGNTQTENNLNRNYQNANGQAAARTLLDAVGRVITPTGFGTGTVLSIGGNRWVLTADHVVAGIPANQIQFIVPTSLGSSTPQTLNVIRVHRRDLFGGRDLALLELSNAVTGIQGALLPDFSLGHTGTQVLAVGYGINNRGGAGARNFGYMTVDEIHKSSLSPNQPSGLRVTYPGPFSVYRYDTGDVATAPGDAGGPDIVPIQQIDRQGNVLWIPAIATVHSSGESTVDIDGDGDADVSAVGDRTYSTVITAEVSLAIRQIIPAPAAPSLVLEQINVREDGDSEPGRGEWRFIVQINGLQHQFYREFNEGLHTLNLRFNVGWTNQVDLAFFGVEEDDGFFSGSDDELGRWQSRELIPSRMLGLRRWITTPVVSWDGTEYQLVYSIG
jgi:hypothetical protein